MSLQPYPAYKDSGVEWLGKIPAEWSAAPLSRFLRFKNGSDYTAVEVSDGGYPVYGSGGVFRRASSFLHDGESVLFGRKGTIDRPLYVNGRFWTVDTMYYTEIDKRRLNPKYLYYWATQLPFDYWVTSTALPSMTQTDLGSARIPALPLEAQRQIVEFLDRETAEIDAFIADQEELIALLTERRDSVWQAKVDELGLTSVVVPVRRAIRTIVDGPFGSSLTSAHYVESGARVVRLGNIGIDSFKDRDKAFISLEYFEQLSAHEVCAGDVVIAGLGDEKMPLGRATVVPDLGGPAIVKADCYRVRPNELVSADYLAWILSSPQSRAQMKVLSRGSTRARLNTSVVREVLIPIPSRHDQDEVIERTSTVIREIDAAVADAQEAIALSNERRAALISAAVTGKIDVRNHGGVE